MTKLYKPFEGHPEFQCFGCSPSNPIGLNLEFKEEGEYITSEWIADELYQGFTNLLHGGIQTTLMDEMASWCVSVKAGLAAVTKELKINFHKPVFTDGKKILLRTKLLNMKNNIALIHVELFDSNDRLCSEGEFEFFTFPEKIGKRKFNFPGKEAYYSPSEYL